MTSVLAINCGSSSLKYALFHGDHAVARGVIDRIRDGGTADPSRAIAAALERLFDDLPDRLPGAPGAPDAIGHRLVHGGPDRFDPVVLDAAVLAELAGVAPLAPLHLQIELCAIEALRARFPALPQVACFDTAFHRALPERARRFALPRALHDAGVRRYGFHGLSYEHVAHVLAPERQRRAIFAHLGSGASMVAVRDGQAIDTTMAFTPAAGLVMGTRPGDLDPGLVVYLLDHLGYDARRLDRLINAESGLVALSETTADMRQLLAQRASDPRAALAIEVFCYRARMAIGALSAALGGLDTLVFTGGIGEHAPAVRAQICEELAHLGVVIDPAANAANATRIAAGNCEIFVVAADEEQMIARHTRRALGSRAVPA